MTKYLHTNDPRQLAGRHHRFLRGARLREIGCRPDEKGRYTHVFLAPPDEEAAVELTYN
jgi:hypothetical protein